MKTLRETKKTDRMRSAEWICDDKKWKINVLVHVR